MIRRLLGMLAVVALVATAAGTAVPGPVAAVDGGSWWTLPKGPGYVETSRVIGRSVNGRRIVAHYRGYRDAPHVLLVLGQMHGDEPAGRRTAQFVRDRMVPRERTGIWTIVSMNPDGAARGTRTNARGVDLNRNWPTSGWTSAGRGGRYWGGPRRASEPETRAMIAFLRDVRPDYIASIHQPLAAIGSSSRDIAWQRRLASNLGLPRRHLGVGNPSGTVSPTLTGWYDSTLGAHGVATTIEFGSRPGRRFLTARAADGITQAALVR